MKTVLYPAIALMNRLSFGMKFSLISVLFFLPMLVTNFYLVRDSYRQFVSTRAELQSLQLIASGMQIRRDVEAYNDLLQINIGIGQTRTTGDLDSRIGQLQQRLHTALSALQPVARDSEQVAAFTAKRDELLAALKAVEAEGSMQSKAGMAMRLLSNVQIFNKLLATQSGLSQDDSAEVRQMADLISSVTPAVTETISRGRVLGTAALGQGFLNSSTSGKLDDLLQDLEKLHAEYALKLQEALGASSAAQQALAGEAEASRETLKSLGKLIEDKVVMADSLDLPWAQFYDQVSQGMDKTYQLNDKVLGYLGGQLEQRLTGKQAQMVLLVVALLVVFLAIVYLYGGFYVSTRSTLKSLGAMMERVAAGDMTVNYQAQSRDELGELGQAFNETVRRVHDLIEQVGRTVAEVERQTGRVEVVSAQSNQAVAGQRNQIEQVATAMNQMAATAQEVARSAAAAVGSAQSVNQETVSGRDLVESQVGSIQRLAGEIDESVAVINQLAADSASISRVLDVIKGIAEQTNLLALNAAIEAARAGEQGRGFAVVADEVRALARRTHTSTQEVHRSVSLIQERTRTVVGMLEKSRNTSLGNVASAREASEALHRVTRMIGQVRNTSQQIASVTGQQASTSEQLSHSLASIASSADDASRSAGQVRRRSHDLQALAERLGALVSRFRL